MDPKERTDYIIGKCEETMASAEYINHTPLSEVLTNRLLIEILRRLDNVSNDPK